ncbi:unnamed protein product [Meloidogyne enterolobii]|uniref:Uncharacterized protein n=1 Tax=Meloidogyne enterolobii TaxID=390850 RepID=A0ACB0XZG8_MELEN
MKKVYFMILFISWIRTCVVSVFSKSVTGNIEPERPHFFLPKYLQNCQTFSFLPIASLLLLWKKAKLIGKESDHSAYLRTWEEFFIKTTFQKHFSISLIRMMDSIDNYFFRNKLNFKKQ